MKRKARTPRKRKAGEKGRRERESQPMPVPTIQLPEPPEPAESGEEPSPQTAPVPWDPLSGYYQSIRHYPILSREEEKALAVRYLKKKDLEAAYKLVTGNLRLVVKISLEYRRMWREIMDLIQEGNVGLMQAVKKYDPYRGVRFSSYAAWWIRAYILRYIVNNARMVKLGTTQAQRTLFFQLGKERERLRRMGIEPDSKALAASLDVKESEVDEMAQRLAGTDLSLDAPRGEEEGMTLMDAIPSSQPAADELVGNAQVRTLYLDLLATFVASLSEREKRIFKARWMRDDPLTLQEVGEQLRITRERVRQLETRILRRLREHMEAEGLSADDFLR